MAVNQLSDGNVEGTTLGQSTSDLVAFHGSAPSAQRSGTDQAAVSTSTAIAVSSGYGFSTMAQANAIIALVNEIRATLVAKGLMAGS